MRVSGPAAALALLAASIVTTAAGAEAGLSDAAGRYAISSAGSAIRFSIDQIAGGGIQGAFGSFSGRLTIDGDDVSRSHVDITIFPASVATGQDRMDAFLRSNAVFDTDHEKEIVFHSTSVKRTGERTAVIVGRLTARGKSFQETFAVTLDRLGNGSIAFRVTGRVFRSRYGMDVGTPIYSNVVDFDMALTGRRS